MLVLYRYVFIICMIVVFVLIYKSVFVIKLFYDVIEFLKYDIRV